jgi:hypothetical protein
MKRKELQPENSLYREAVTNKDRDYTCAISISETSAALLCSFAMSPRHLALRFCLLRCSPGRYCQTSIPILSHYRKYSLP